MKKLTKEQIRRLNYWKLNKKWKEQLNASEQIALMLKQFNKKDRRLIAEIVINLYPDEFKVELDPEIQDVLFI